VGCAPLYAIAIARTQPAATVYKFQYSVKLNSPSLYKDGVCSLIGTILAIALFVNTLIIESAHEAWWIDPVVAICAGVGSILFGLYGVCTGYFRDKLPLLSCRWWFASHGAGKEEPDVNDNDGDGNGAGGSSRGGGGGRDRPGPEQFDELQLSSKDSDEVGEII